MNTKKINKQDLITYGIILLIAIGFFFLLGEEVPAIDDDVAWYTTINPMDSVMPIYPLYSYVCKHIFGENNAFTAMVVIQNLLAMAMTIGFTLYIRSRLNLSGLVTVVLYACTLLPFAIYLPRCTISQIVLTESIAFPLTYLMFYYHIRSFWEGRIRYCIYAMILSAFMYLLRSELLIAIMYCGLILFIQMIRLYSNSILRVIVKLAIAGVSMIAVFGACFMFHQYYFQIMVPELNPEWAIEESTEKDEETGDTEINEADEASEQSTGIKIQNYQIRRLIVNRGMYLLQDDDYLRYSDNPEMAGACQAAVAAIRAGDPTGLLQDNPIDYTRPWDEQGMVSEYNADLAQAGLEEYYENLYPEDTAASKATDAMVELAVMAIISHPGQGITTVVRLFLAGIQAAIFYQSPSYYVPCEIITLVLLIAAIVLIVLGIKERCTSTALLILALLAIVIYDAIVCIIHFPLQRYLVYFQGIFYVGMVVTFIEVISSRIGWVRKIAYRN